MGCAWFFEERRGRPFIKVIKSAFLYIKDYLIETNAVFHLKESEKMSDKKMLNEASIRKMMKLANIPSLTDKFIKENYFEYNEEMAYQRDDEEPMDEPPMDDAPMEEPEMEMDAEVDIEEPAGDDLPAAEELVQDLMGVLEKHFDDVEFNVDVEGEEEMPMDEPAMDMGDEEEELELDEPMGDEPPAMDDEEEPMMETELEEEALEEADLEEEESFGAGLADAAAKDAQTKADIEMMPEEETLEEEDLEEMEGDDAHNALIDAIAAKVAERLLAEAKKTNE